MRAAAGGRMIAPAFPSGPAPAIILAMPKLDPADWWTMRPAQNRTPAHYRCPLCGLRLHAMTPHVLIAPEGDMNRRRHAHSECVEAARRQGRLPLRSEWQSQQPKPKRWWQRR